MMVVCVVCGLACGPGRVRKRLQTCSMVVSGFDLTINPNQEVVEVLGMSVSCHRLPVEDRYGGVAFA